MARKMMMNQKDRRIVSKAVQKVLKETYFKQIPLDALGDALVDSGMIMLQEDNTEWAGWLCGEKGRAFFRIAPISSGIVDENIQEEFYTPYENAGLLITWYKCESRYDSKYEVIGYIS